MSFISTPYFYPRCSSDLYLDSLSILRRCQLVDKSSGMDTPDIVHDVDAVLMIS
jgi:hypothetical protein